MSSFTEHKEIDKIEVTAMNTIQVRECNILYKDGEELTRSFSRYVLNPGDNLDGQPERVKAIAEVTWTSEVVSEYKSRTVKNIN